MATRSVRWTVTRHVVELLRGAPGLVGVDVWSMWPGDRHVVPAMIWVDGIDGDLEIPVFQAGRKQRDDRFSLPVLTRVFSRSVDDADGVMERLIDITAVVGDLLADDPGIQGLDGVVSAEVISESQTGMVTQEGVSGWGRTELSIHSRLV